MLYAILKLPAKLAFHFYCRKLKINKPEWFNQRGPLLIAANHPNSFLDAIVMATLFRHPVHSLVRGDVYINRFYSFLLNQLNMLPVYRLSEGAENLENNYSTFERCREVFRKNGIVLIFSEGRCINEWKLRSLKKGTARLAMSAWQQGIPLKVIPVGINFSSFRRFGKDIHLNFGKPISTGEIAYPEGGKAITVFNNRLHSELKNLVYENDNDAGYPNFFGTNKHAGKWWLTIPAGIGWMVAAPLYYPVRLLVKKKWNNDHFDSIMVAILFAAFPVYLTVLVIIISFSFSPGLGLLSIPIILLTIFALLHFRQNR